MLPVITKVENVSDCGLKTDSMHRVPPQPQCPSSPCARVTSGCAWPPLLDTMVCSAFGLQALQDIEPRLRPTGLLDQPTIAQIA